MSAISTTKEGRVNVPLGVREQSLAKQANKIGTTKTNLARILLIDGLTRLVHPHHPFIPKCSKRWEGMRSSPSN